MSDLLPPPPFTVPTPTGDNARDQAWTMLTARYGDAGKWAGWAGNIMLNDIADINNALGRDVATADLARIYAYLDAITKYIAPSSLTYNAPTAPVFEVVPALGTLPTLGTLTTIPTISEIIVGDAPTSTLSFTAGTFTETLLTDVKARLVQDIATCSTGLGATVEAAMFARAVARQNAIRAAAYTEITTAFGASGWDVPPGALTTATEVESDKSELLLSEINGKILEETTRLALDYNKHILSVSTQLLSALATVFDSQEVRRFDAAKTAVQLAAENFKQAVAAKIAQADIDKTRVNAVTAANEGTVKVFESQLQAVLAPVKAKLDVNQTKATTYEAEVRGAVANLEAQIAPEDLKIKGVALNVDIAKAKADLGVKEVDLAIQAAARQLQLEVTTLQGLSQSAMQIVASSLNSVHVSTGFGFSGSQSQVLNTEA